MNREYLGTYDERLGETLGAALLRPTRIYVKALRALKTAGISLHACGHITGGGFYENIPRMLTPGFCAVVERDSYSPPLLFDRIAGEGSISREMMYNTFNMGIGMVLAVPEREAERALSVLSKAGERAFCIGHIEAGDGGLELW